MTPQQNQPGSPTSAKRVLIASDHAGFALKETIKRTLPGWQWIDLGPVDAGSSVYYTDFASRLGRQLASGDAQHCILICGSGIGMSIAANKMPGVRAAV